MRDTKRVKGAWRVPGPGVCSEAGAYLPREATLSRDRVGRGTRPHAAAANAAHVTRCANAALGTAPRITLRCGVAANDAFRREYARYEGSVRNNVNRRKQTLAALLPGLGPAWIHDRILQRQAEAVTQRSSFCIALLSLLLLAPAVAQEANKKPAEPTAPARIATSVERAYRGYKPDFRGYRPSAKQMKLSSEPSFFTRCLIQQSMRANALIKAGLENEEKGLYRIALESYQQVIDRYPDTLYKVSPFGTYVPAGHYCQLRILGFPKEHLDFYRVKYDARARDAFQIAVQRYSLEGLAHIRDSMLCTSYGPRSLLVLGDAAADRGHYLAALEYYDTAWNCFTDDRSKPRELALKIAYCRKLLGDKVTQTTIRGSRETALSNVELAGLNKLVREARPAGTGIREQRFSPPHLTADDYTLMPPTQDPLALKAPVWSRPMVGGRMPVITRPVVTARTIIYRHRNIVYARSILNGELRWENDVGGSVDWHSYHRCRREDILVHDGMVFTPIQKFGPTLVALDEITGQVKWSYGPMAASDVEEAQLRFRTAPAAGPRSVYAGYVKDNVASGVHVDSEYGVIAFDSLTGRIKWQRSLCRLQPGKFAANWRVSGTRIRVRSFSSPPLYHQGTVYYCPNAGCIVAMDALSGRVKWLTKYPYYVHPNDIHDATRGFGGHSNHMHPPGPMLWMNQPPLVVGDDLYVLPLDSEFWFKLDRRTGKVHWSRNRLDRVYGLSHARGSGCGNGGSTAYFFGPIETGELLFVYSMRAHGAFTLKNRPRRSTPGGIFLVDPKTGHVIWASEDPVATHTKHPSLYYHGDFSLGRTRDWCIGVNELQFQVTARPFLSSDGKLYVSSVGHACWPIYGMLSNLAVLDLGKLQFTDRRYFISGDILRACDNLIQRAPRYLSYIEKQPAHVRKDPGLKRQEDMLRRIVKDTVPQNEHPAFKPFSRMTFKRHGQLFELRISPDAMSMVYDREAVKRSILSGQTAEDLFASAELAASEDRLEAAAGLMKQCLARMPAEDEDFRTVVNQLMYRVCRRLVRGSIRARDPDAEMKHVLAMSRAATSLADEIQTLFAVTDVHERKGNHAQVGRFLRSIISRFGNLEYSVSPLLRAAPDTLVNRMADVTGRGRKYVQGTRHTPLLTRAMDAAPHGLPLYRSAVSPAPTELTVPAGSLAAERIRALQAGTPKFKAVFEKQAQSGLAGDSVEERMVSLAEFPGTEAGRAVFDAVLGETRRKLNAADNTTEAAVQRQRLVRLSEMGRTSGYPLGDLYPADLLASPRRAPMPLAEPLQERSLDMEEERGAAWLVLERNGDRNVKPTLLFLGGRVRKKFDHKFLLYALNTTTGKVAWKATEPRGGDAGSDEIRLKGKGDEPGFFEAFVHGDIVVVHGLFDVLAFNLDDGKLRWRYRVPFSFEIGHVVKTGAMLVLAGTTETVVLYLPTRDPRGEVLWQEKEFGDLYAPPYVLGERLVSLRKQPFNMTVRHRGTGTLIGRLDLPDLRPGHEHPILEDNAPAGPPVAHDGRFVAVCDYDYYLLLDAMDIRVVWKRKIDVTSDTPLRVALNGDHLSVIKKDYDVKAIYMLSSRTGGLLWKTDPKERGSPQPIYCMTIHEGKLFGIKPHPGQGFYFVGMNAATGKHLFKPLEQKGYEGIPKVRLRGTMYGNVLVAEAKDRQDYELKLFDTAKGRLVRTVKVKGSGDFGEHGRASAAVQPGGLALMGKNELKIVTRER